MGIFSWLFGPSQAERDAAERAERQAAARDRQRLRDSVQSEYSRRLSSGREDADRRRASDDASVPMTWPGTTWDTVGTSRAEACDSSPSRHSSSSCSSSYSSSDSGSSDSGSSSSSSSSSGSD